MSILLHYTRMNYILTQNQNYVATEAQTIMTGFEELIAEASHHPLNLIPATSLQNLAKTFHKKILTTQMHTFSSPLPPPSIALPPQGQGATLVTVEMLQKAKAHKGGVFDLWYPLLVTISDVWEAWTVGLKFMFPPVSVMEVKDGEYKNWRAEDDSEYDRYEKFHTLEVIVKAIEQYKEEEDRVRFMKELEKDRKQPRLMSLGRRMSKERWFAEQAPTRKTGLTCVSRYWTDVWVSSKGRID